MKTEVKTVYRCDHCKHQEYYDGFFCKKGHWEGLEDRDKFDVDSIEVYEFPFSDCSDFEDKNLIP